MCKNKKGLTYLMGLQNYSFESKMLMAQCYSSRITGLGSISLESIQKYCSLITPNEIEIFTLFSILYDDPNQTNKISSREFSDYITFIRNYWSPHYDRRQKKGSLPEDLFMLLALQQLPSQDSFLIKLYRYYFIFSFENEKINMKKTFIDKFECDYINYARFAYIIAEFTSVEMCRILKELFCKTVVSKALMDSVVKKHLTVTKEDYKKEILSYYQDNIEDCFYGIKLQSWFPLIEDNNCTYIPSPYLTITAVTDSLLNRLTEGNNTLRSIIGKEVIEEYLYSIYSQLSTVTYITRELPYGKDLLSPDVIVSESDECIFFDTKAKTPSLKLRQFDDETLDKEIEIYAKNIKQLYNRICDYLSGLYSLDRSYDKMHIFGVSVVFDDSYLPRSKIYNLAFSLIRKDNPSISQDELNFIHSRIKIIPLKDIENRVIRNRSVLPLLRQQALNEEHWDDYQFSEEFETDCFISDFKAFHDQLIDYVKQLGNQPQ